MNISVFRGAPGFNKDLIVQNYSLCNRLIKTTGRVLTDYNIIVTFDRVDKCIQPVQ